MKIYVAGASSELARCHHFMAGVRRACHTVTCDWPAAMLAEGDDQDLTHQALRRAALEDFAGVDACELFILLCPRGPHSTVGAYVELGYAQKAGKLAWIVGGRKGPFTSLADLRFETDQEALQALGEIRP